MRKVHSLLLVMLVLLLAACGGEEEADEEVEARVATVEVEEVLEGDMTIERSLFGRIAANSTVPVMLEMPGEISDLEVNNGERVDEDERLAVISTPVGNQTIRAPRAGVVASLQGSGGDFVSNEEPFAVIAGMKPFIVQASVTGKLHELLEEDDEIAVIVDGKEYEAVVISLDSLPDETGLYPVQLELDEEETEDAEILPGAAAEVIIPEQRLEEVLLVPSEAVVTEEDESVVYVVKDDVVERKVVTVTEVQSSETAIESDGVEAGDQVVTTGHLTISDGAEVNVAGGE